MRASPDRPNWRAALWLRRQRIRGRRRFIWGWLIPRFAVPAAALATVVRALGEPFRWGHFLAHVAVNVVGAGLVGGYVAGRLLWELVVAEDRRRREIRRRAAPGRARRGTTSPPPPAGADPPP